MKAAECWRRHGISTSSNAHSQARSRDIFAEETIPRSAIDKVSCHPFDREELLLPSELAIRLNFTGRDSKSLIEAANLSPNLYKQGVENHRRHRSQHRAGSVCSTG